MKTKTQLGKADAQAAVLTLRQRSRFTQFLVRFRKNWQLHMLVLLPLLYIFIFDFGPMYGLQIGFREFKPRAGIWHSEWVGLKHMINFVTAYNYGELLWNTVAINLYQTFFTFPIPIFLALMLHVNEHKWLVKITQNVTYVPHFISTVVMVGILNQVLSPVSGIVGNVYRAFGGIGLCPDIRASAAAFRHLYVWSGTWQGMGWATILYVAALSGVSSDLHEAAELDGASRWKRVIYVDLPTIMPTVIIKFIMQFGSMMSVGYQKVYLMQNDLNLATSEVISTYIYKVGLGKMQMSFSTAVGLFNSMINTSLLFLANGFSRWLSSGEQGLF